MMARHISSLPPAGGFGVYAGVLNTKSEVVGVGEGVLLAFTGVKDFATSRS